MSRGKQKVMGFDLLNTQCTIQAMEDWDIYTYKYLEIKQLNIAEEKIMKGWNN